MRELLREYRDGKFQVTLWATNKIDKRGQTGIAWRVKQNGKKVAESKGPSDYVYGSPMHADDSKATMAAAMTLIAHSALHDANDNPVNPGWDAEELYDLGSMLEEDEDEDEEDEDEDEEE